MISSPKPPDPVATAQAQAGMNRDTAITQQQLNMVNQNNPWGSVNYQQTGTNKFQDASGKWVETPQFTQNTTYNPQFQAIFDDTTKAQGNLAGLAADQSGKMREYLNDPFTFDNQDAANWAYDLGAQRLDPRFEREQEALRTQLINQGIRPGTAAYNAEMGRMGESKNDAYNQLMLTGRSQAFNEALTQRNQPINELSALLSGSQVANPAQQSGPTPQTGVGGVDYTGLVNQQYQAEVQNHQAKLGGLFGLAAAPFQMFKFSDVRLKTDIRRVGTTDAGKPVYIYRYIDGGPFEMGVMAHDAPEASIEHPSGFKMVDYRKVH